MHSNCCALCPVQVGAYKRSISGQWLHILCAIWVRLSCRSLGSPVRSVAGMVHCSPRTGAAGYSHLARSASSPLAEPTAVRGLVLLNLGTIRVLKVSLEALWCSLRELGDIRSHLHSVQLPGVQFSDPTGLSTLSTLSTLRTLIVPAASWCSVLGSDGLEWNSNRSNIAESPEAAVLDLRLSAWRLHPMLRRRVLRVIPHIVRTTPRVISAARSKRRRRNASLLLPEAWSSAPIAAGVRPAQRHAGSLELLTVAFVFRSQTRLVPLREYPPKSLTNARCSPSNRAVSSCRSFRPRSSTGSSNIGTFGARLRAHFC